MIVNKKSIYLLCLIISIGVLILLTSHFAIEERRTCAAAPILTEKEYSCLEESDSFDATSFLMQNDHPVARDTTTNTIYISIPPLDDLNFWELPARLSSSHPEYSLCFAPDQAFEDFRTAVAQNHVFTLLIVRENHFVPYSVIFTTLPILELMGPILKDRDAVRRGSFTLWDPYSSETGYSISTSETEWHSRGGATKGSIKQSYKINLKKQGTDENRNLSVLNLGNDDDWILGPLYFDDLKIREQLVTAVWNSYQEKKGSTLQMSNAEYVEVIMNGRYHGLYLIRRRIDNKYLDSSRAENIIMEGSIPHNPATVEEAYPIKFNPASIPTEQIYDLMFPYYQAMSLSEDFLSFPEINWDSWLDVNILIDAFSLDGNRSYKNMFYILRRQNNRHILEYIPWDVDMALGTRWESAISDFVYDTAQMNRSTPLYRREAAAFLELDPTLKNKLALRWFELRTDSLSINNLESLIDFYHTMLTKSGALFRDENRWGLYYQGKDTLESLLHNLPIHLSNMDDYYQSILSQSICPDTSEH